MFLMQLPSAWLRYRRILKKTSGSAGYSMPSTMISRRTIHGCYSRVAPRCPRHLARSIGFPKTSMSSCFVMTWGLQVIAISSRRIWAARRANALPMHSENLPAGISARIWPLVSPNFSTSAELSRTKTMQTVRPCWSNTPVSTHQNRMPMSHPGSK